MQPTLPITVAADGRFSDSLRPLLNKLEMWINYQALKANWYGHEGAHLCFDFRLVRRLDEKKQQFDDAPWIVSDGYAYHYQATTFHTQAFIAVADIVNNGVAIEQSIKARLVSVANRIASQHGFKDLVS